MPLDGSVDAFLDIATAKPKRWRNKWTVCRPAQLLAYGRLFNPGDEFDGLVEHASLEAAASAARDILIRSSHRVWLGAFEVDDA